MNKFDIILFVLLMSLMVGSFYLGTQSETIKEITGYVISDKKITSTTECGNLSLEETASCLVEYVRPFYNYTMRSDIDRTLEDVQQNGGDCYDYTLLYIKIAKNLGFYAKEADMDTDKDTAHAIAIISNPEGYCVIDQLNYHCKWLKSVK